MVAVSVFHLGEYNESERVGTWRYNQTAHIPAWWLAEIFKFLIGQQVFSNRYNKNTGQGRILSKLTNFNSYAGV